MEKPTFNEAVSEASEAIHAAIQAAYRAQAAGGRSADGRHASILLTDLQKCQAWAMFIGQQPSAETVR